MRMPEPLTAKSGLTRTATRGRMPRAVPTAAIRVASFSDSSSIVTPAATACRSSASVLPGPAKLTRFGGIGVSSATPISMDDATSKESTRPLRCCTTAGIGFALMA
jgi:hypothetical protein